jgi:multidrug efflux pump
MNISEVCIKRPVFATVLSLILIVIGIMGLHYLDTRFLPKFENNHLWIETNYAGASAALVETSITTPLEEAVSGIEGIDTVSSTSYRGFSDITITLKDGVTVNDVANKVRDKVENTRSKLPDSVTAPEVETGGNGSGELMDIGFVDPNMDLPAIRDYLKRYVVNAIGQISGVAKVNYMGAGEYTMQVRLNPAKMAARQITIAEVQQAIKNSNIELPAGKIRGLNVDYPITAATKLNTAAEFNQIVVKQAKGKTIRIADIGQAKIAPDTTTDSFVRVNNKPGILLNIHATDEANPIDTSSRIKHYLKSISTDMPSGMKAIVAYDQSTFMKDSIYEVYVSILFSILCVLVIIYCFLGQLRSVAIPIVTIPICIFATFGIMYFLGFTINIITLLALVLSIGLVVDDAIVMLENVHRHIEAGEKPLMAAIKGSKEMTFAIVAMTLTLAAVYAPVGLIHGKISAIFKPFALTLAGAVIISGFVALTLSPMMCAHLLKPHTTSRYVSFLDRLFLRLGNGYQQALGFILNKRYLVIITMVFIIIGGFFLVKSVPFTFMPKEDVGIVMGKINTPSGSNIHYLANQTQGVAKIFDKEPDIQSLLSLATTSQEGFNLSFASLKPFDQRHLSAQQIADRVNAKIKQVPGLNASAFPPSFGGSMQHQLEFSIMGDKSYKELYEMSKKLKSQLSHYPGLKNITSSLTFDSQQYNVNINRKLAAQLDVSVNSIDNVMATMLGGIKVSTIDVQAQSYDVYLLGSKKLQNNLSNINKLYVSNRAGQLIPLSNLIKVTPTLMQPSLPHYNRMRSATIDAQLGSGYNLGQVVPYLEKTLPKLLPADVHYAFQGMAKDTAESNSSMGLIFILALIFIYLVLSAQFESFLDPFVILLAVPFSVIGALLSLKLFHGSINIYTIVGLVTLIGLIAKHGILITQFTNDLKRQGEKVKMALLKAARIRLRPILMTTAAMIFGALPLVFTSGASASSREQIGLVIISGLLFGTFFSLVLVPVTYTFIEQLKQTLKKWRNI